MLQNAKITAFIFSKLLMENQQRKKREGGDYLPTAHNPPQIRVDGYNVLSLASGKI